MHKIVLIAHNLRSCHNVGSLLRTAEGLGVDKVYLTGYTPHPGFTGDSRMPHIVQKLTKQIEKTSLGAERQISWKYEEDVFKVISDLQSLDYTVVALEQTADAKPLPVYQIHSHVALIVGREVEGIEPEVLDACNQHLMIPMFGHKESFNVVQAAAMALYQLRFASHAKKQ